MIRTVLKNLVISKTMEINSKICVCVCVRACVPLSSLLESKVGGNWSISMSFSVSSHSWVSYQLTSPVIAAMECIPLCWSSVRVGYISLEQICSCFSIPCKSLRQTCNNRRTILLMQVYKFRSQVFTSLHVYVGTRGDHITCLCRNREWAGLQHYSAALLRGHNQRWLYSWLGVPRGRSGRARKISPSKDSWAHNECPYRLRYRGRH